MRCDVDDDDDRMISVLLDQVISQERLPAVVSCSRTSPARLLIMDLFGPPHFTLSPSATLRTVTLRMNYYYESSFAAASAVAAKKNRLCGEY